MKRELLLSLFYCLSFLMVLSCSDDKEDLLPVNEEWKAKNEVEIDKIKKNPEFTALKSLNEMGYIYYKVLEEAEATDDNPLILYGEKVYANYEGWLIDDTLFDSRNKEDGPLPGFTVGGGIIEGWNTALQYMRIGDKWEIWVPQELAYGRRGSAEGSVTILPYSALHFVIEVVDVDRIK